MTQQRAILYKPGRPPQHLAPDDYNSPAGWALMRHILGFETLQPALLRLDGKWIQFIMDDNGRLVPEPKVNTNASALWLSATGHEINLVGNVIVLTYERKPRR